MGVSQMSTSSTEQRALKLLKTLEDAGKSVRRIAIDGRRIEVELSSEGSEDEFDGIDMRHGQA